MEREGERVWLNSCGRTREGSSETDKAQRKRKQREMIRGRRRSETTTIDGWGKEIKGAVVSGSPAGLAVTRHPF